MKGQRFWLTSILVVSVGLAWSGISPAAQSTPVVAPSIDPLEITATEIIQRATMTGAANHIATHQAVFAALTAIPNSHATTMAADPLNITATAIIARATQTAAVNLTATQASLIALTATLTPYDDDPLNLTATAHIARATMTAAALLPPTPTPSPTFTFQQVEALRTDWESEIEIRAGFDHQVFDDIVDELIRAVRGGFFGIGHEFHPVSQIMLITFEDSTFVFILINREAFLLGHRLFMFRLTEEQQPEWITNSVQPDELCCLLFLADADYTGNFPDRNSNGYPDAAIYTGNGGNCPVDTLVLLEIRTGGEVVVITPETTDVWAHETVDLDMDGILEIEAIGRPIAPLPSSGCNYPFMTRYYGWDGTTYKDISPTLDDTYWPVIGEFWANIEQWDGCLVPGIPMYEMLFGYQAMGRLEEGWLRLLPHLNWNICSDEDVEFYGAWMLNLVAWVGAHLEDENQP